MTLWRLLIAFLTWLSADAAAIDAERPKAAAAVAAARACLATSEPTPAPTPPSKCICGGTCVNGFWKPDGRVQIACPCPASCDCKKPKACPDGKCPTKSVLR